MEAIEVIQVRDDGVWTKVINSGDGELMDLGNILEAKPAELADGLNVKSEGKGQIYRRMTEQLGGSWCH